MVFWKKLLHRHKWEVISKAPAVLTFTSVVFNCETKIDAVVILEKCSCGKKRAYAICADGRREHLDMVWLDANMKNPPVGW